MRRIFRPHPVYGYGFVPNLKARVLGDDGSYLVRTNARGFRSNFEFELRKPPGTFRILLFGDSFTAADGVRNEDRYSDVLGSLLPGVETLNFAMPGTGTDQQYLIFREETAGFEYDLIVVAVLVENIRRIVARYRPFHDEDGEQGYFAKPYFSLGTDGTLDLGGTPVPPEPLSFEQLPEAERAHIDVGGRFAGLRKIANALGARDIIQKMTRYQPVPEYDDASDPAWLLMKAILGRFIAESRSPVLLFPLPLYQHIEETAPADGYQARFAELHDPARVIVHDPLAHLQARGPAERRALRHARDIHPTPAGHRVIAESLAAGVRPFLRLPVAGSGGAT